MRARSVSVAAAKRSLGQNFLVDPNLQRKTVQALGATGQDTVIEIGPGTGALTRLLASRVHRLIAIEKDDVLAERLRTELGSDVEIITGDALAVDLSALAAPIDQAKVIGNIPYNITTPLIFKLLEPGRRPAALVLTVQREVADRIVARAGTSEYGALSVGVQTVARVERLFTVGRKAFRPVPRVDSALVRMVPFQPPRLSVAEERDLRILTRVAFGWRRKQMQRTLRDAPEYDLELRAVEQIAQEVGIDMIRRPETLSPDDFRSLARALRAIERPHPLALS